MGVNIPDGYVPVYFELGKDDFDAEMTLVQVSENGEQLQTEINWLEGTKTRKGVLYVPKEMDSSELLQIRLDVKPEQAQLLTHMPDDQKIVLSLDEEERIQVNKYDRNGDPIKDKPHLKPKSTEVTTFPTTGPDPFDELMKKAFGTDTWDRLK